MNCFFLVSLSIMHVYSVLLDSCIRSCCFLVYYRRTYFIGSNHKVFELDIPPYCPWCFPNVWGSCPWFPSWKKFAIFFFLKKNYTNPTHCGNRCKWSFRAPAIRHSASWWEAHGGFQRWTRWWLLQNHTTASKLSNTTKTASLNMASQLQPVFSHWNCKIWVQQIWLWMNDCIAS